MWDLIIELDNIIFKASSCFRILIFSLYATMVSMVAIGTITLLKLVPSHP